MTKTKTIDMTIAFNSPLQIALNYETPEVTPIIKNHAHVGNLLTYETYMGDIYHFKHYFKKNPVK